MDTATQDRVTVAEKATAPGLAAPSSEHQQHAESTTPEPHTATCASCGAVEPLYELGSGGILCVGCIASAVSLAANDLWPDAVTYSREFEKVLIYG